MDRFVLKICHRGTEITLRFGPGPGLGPGLERKSDLCASVVIYNGLMVVSRNYFFLASRIENSVAVGNTCSRTKPERSSICLKELKFRSLPPVIVIIKTSIQFG